MNPIARLIEPSLRRSTDDPAATGMTIFHSSNANHALAVGDRAAWMVNGEIRLRRVRSPAVARSKHLFAPRMPNIRSAFYQGNASALSCMRHNRCKYCFVPVQVNNHNACNCSPYKGCSAGYRVVFG